MSANLKAMILDCKHSLSFTLACSSIQKGGETDKFFFFTGETFRMRPVIGHTLVFARPFLFDSFFSVNLGAHVLNTP